jgi:hypothetical protein
LENTKQPKTTVKQSNKEYNADIEKCKIEAKQQVLAHLANFAYDPINYNNLWDFYAVDIFIGKI